MRAGTLASAGAKPVGRNAPCPCGSGRKYKHCCLSGRTASHGTSATECYESGNAHLGRDQLDAAIEQFRRAVSLQPAFYQAHSNLGIALEAQGLRTEAFDSYGAAVRYSARSSEAAGTFVNYLICLGTLQRELFEMLRSDVHSPEQVLARHLTLARQLQGHSQPSRRAHTNTRDPERRLRVGYLSPDFRTHSVAYFITPIIAGHDRRQAEVFCYHNCPLADGVTSHIAQLADHWLPCTKMSDDTLAARIRADGIDILVDLAGHTIGNRILTFALKPAPVQISYLGYPHVTGLDAMDYLLTDEFAASGHDSDTPPAERMLQLEPSMLVYQPPLGQGGLLGGAAPAVVPAPVLHKGYVTFGCFNDISKVTDTLIGIWARVLAAVPSSRLLLKSRGLEEPGLRSALLLRFMKHGVNTERLILEGRIDDPATHLCRYGEVDIALDTAPYNGVTTSFEALWMGVPFVTLAGGSLAARMGTSIATNVGHPEWIAHTPQQYIDKAVSLARDAAASNLRHGLRQELKACALMDAHRFTRNLEVAYREVWQRWCSTR
jgi:predicted O-linked N-acetylglucosamine transferase (SPINDLY family)